MIIGAYEKYKIGDIMDNISDSKGIYHPEQRAMIIRHATYDEWAEWCKATVKDKEYLNYHLERARYEVNKRYYEISTD